MKPLILLTTGGPASDWGSLWLGRVDIASDPVGLPWYAAELKPNADADGAPALRLWRDVALPVHGGADSLLEILERQEASLLALLEPAAMGLAATLSTTTLEDAKAWLADWQWQAEQVLTWALRHPSRALLIDAAQARANAGLFAQLCQDRLSLPPAAPGAMLPSLTPDPLCLALAVGVTQGDFNLPALEDELRAACTPLTEACGPSIRPEGVVPDFRSALRRLHELRAAATAAQSLALRAEHAERRAQLAQQLSADVAALEAERNAQADLASSLQVELSDTAELYRDALATGRSLRKQSQELRDDLEACQAAHRALEQRLAQEEAELQDCRHSLHIAATQRAGSLADQTKLARDLQRKILGLTQARDAATLACEQQHIQLNARGLELTSRRDELVDLQRALAQAKDELLQRVDLADRLARSLELSGGSTFAAAEISVLAEHLDPPHLGLTLGLQHVQSARRRRTDTVVRLVEHHGHPGLVIFASGPEERLLLHWRPSGTEAGVDYVLLIPSDDNSRPLLEALGSTDWSVVVSLSAVIERWLTSQVEERHQHWLHLCRRFREHLLGLPERLRFDGVQVEARSSGSAADAVLQLNQVQWRARHLSQLRLHIDGPGHAAPFELLLDDAGGAPLASWPSDQRGLWLKSCALNMASGPGLAASVDDKDREFLLALLARWPDIRAAAIERDPALAAIASHTTNVALEGMRRSAVASDGDSASHALARIRRRLRHMVAAGTVSAD